MREKTPQTYRMVNVERNDAWVPQIGKMLDAKKGDTMVVVGALHLLGEDGVVEKLRGKGYKVERVCSACAGPADTPRSRSKPRPQPDVGRALARRTRRSAASAAAYRRSVRKGSPVHPSTSALRAFAQDER